MVMVFSPPSSIRQAFGLMVLGLFSQVVGEQHEALFLHFLDMGSAM
jgi:hypothetical protein